jgi:hypothetical protein
MNLKKRILTKNDCYKAGKKIKVKKLMLHSTGANNPKLSRYVDAPELGDISPNHWNQPKPGGREVCVHGFIGKDREGKIATYQTLDWNHRGWGGGGSSNNTHVHVEICEDDLKDKDYFDSVYLEAVELFAYLCKEFDLTEKDIDTHCEGYKKGIASNHADVMHWFPKHGKSMDTFRADVKVLLNAGIVPEPTTTPQIQVKETTVKADMKTNSIVEYLQSIGVNSSFINRQKLAKQYGISNYTGTATQNTKLLNKMRSGSAPKTSTAPKPQPKGDLKTTSVVDYLKSIGQDSSLANRKKLAAKHGIKNYSGTSIQNTQLLKKLRG